MSIPRPPEEESAAGRPTTPPPVSAPPVAAPVPAAPTAAPAPAAPAPPPGPHSPTRGERFGAWLTHAGKTTLVVLGVAAVVVLLYWIASTFLPRWWSETVGNLVDNSIAKGTAWGLFFGFVFTFVPVLVIAQARRAIFKGWRAKLIVVLVGLLLALPNWLTLWVVVGTTDAVHAAERTLDVRAPYFRGWSAVGAAIGLAMALFIVGTGIYLRRRKASFAKREAALEQREALASSRPVAPPAQQPDARSSDHPAIGGQPPASPPSASPPPASQPPSSLDLP